LNSLICHGGGGVFPTMNNYANKSALPLYIKMTCAASDITNSIVCTTLDLKPFFKYNEV